MAPRSRGGRWVIVPDNHDVAMERLAIRRSRRRRRRILLLIVLACIGTGVWAWFERGAAVEIHLVLDGALIFYLALMSEMKKRRVERDAKVRSLAGRRHAPEFARTAQAGGRR